MLAVNNYFKEHEILHAARRVAVFRMFDMVVGLYIDVDRVLVGGAIVEFIVSVFKHLGVMNSLNEIAEVRYNSFITYSPC